MTICRPVLLCLALLSAEPTIAATGLPRRTAQPVHDRSIRWTMPCDTHAGENLDEIELFLLSFMLAAGDDEALPASDVRIGPPANDNFANASLILTPTEGNSPPFPMFSDNRDATKEPGEPDHGGETGGHSVWWKWISPGHVMVSVHSSNSAIPTALAVYTGDRVDLLTSVTPNSGIDSKPEAFFFNATPGTTYYIAVDGTNGAVGDIEIGLGLGPVTEFPGIPPVIPDTPPANDNMADAALIVTHAGDDVGQPLYSNNSKAGKEAGEPNHGDNPGGHSVWWKWTAPSATRATAQSLNSKISTALAVYTGTTVNALTPVTHASHTVTQPGAYYFDAIAGTTYYFAVDGMNGATGEILLTLSTLAAAPPVITSQPGAVTLTEGDSAYPQVTVSGSDPFHYQWYHDNVAIDHANSATIAIVNAKASDAGSYHVVVSNSWGTATSIDFSVTVNGKPGPVITAQPINRTVEVGQAASFNVSATGTGSLGYQWLFNGTVLSGATGATLQLSNVQTGDDGLYTVSVSDSSGSTTSTAARLRVVPATSRPAFTTHPDSQSVAPGMNVVFSVATTGYPSVSLQWLHNDTPITGATGTSLSLNNVQPSDAGSYAVNASNALGTTKSNVATLTVQSQAAPPPPAPSGGGGGGGAPSLWFCLVLGALAAIRRWHRSHSPLLSARD